MSYAVIDSAVGIDADLIAGLLVDPPPPPPPAAGLTAVLEVAVMVGAAIFGMLADPPPPPAGLVAVSYTHLDVYKRQFLGCEGAVGG